MNLSRFRTDEAGVTAIEGRIWSYGELPVGLGVVGIAVVLPGSDFLDEDLFVGNAAIGH